MTVESPVKSSSDLQRRLQRKAFRWGILASLPLGPFLLCLFFAEKIWKTLVTLGTTSFILALVGLALILLIGPFFSLFSGLLALHLRIEAGFASPAGKLGLTDKLFLLAGILASLIPALTAVLIALHVETYRQGLPIRGVSLGLALLFTLLAGLYWKKRFGHKQREQGQ